MASDPFHNPHPLAAAAPAAAHWWGEQVRAARPDGGLLLPELSTEQTLAATVQIALRGQAVDRAALSAGVVTAFVAELARLIAESGDGALTLVVDWGPCDLLAEAANAAGLPQTRFPSKTVLKVWPDHMLARPGYAAPWRLAWSAPDWAHPPCGDQEWPEGWNGPAGSECGLPRWHDGPHDWPST